MIKKQILEGRSIKQAQSNLQELESILKENLKDAEYVKQVFQIPTTKGVSMHSTNEINIDNFEINYFNGFLCLNINEGGKFSIAINETCNILIQQPEPNLKAKILFEDLNMWLLIVK
jgi:hypothetical protein